MRHFSMKRLALACITTFALVGGIGTTNAQMHGGGGLNGGGEFHGGDGFHGNQFHGNGFHGGSHAHAFHDGRFHGGSHVGVFLGAPIILGGVYDAYGYAYPYYDDAPTGSIYWYCSDPAGYYPAVQTCPGGWQQVSPN